MQAFNELVASLSSRAKKVDAFFNLQLEAGVKNFPDFELLAVYDISVLTTYRTVCFYLTTTSFTNAFGGCYSLHHMSKAFTKETGGEDEDLELAPLPAGGKNYMTREGYERLRAELFGLIDDERPKVVEIVHWAASNGDRSENGDYHYGKKRLRDIDRRIRFLTQRLEIAEISDPSIHYGTNQIFFGATVR